MLGFIAMFGALGDLAPEAGKPFRVIQLVLGVTIGGLLWWTGLAIAMRRRQTRLTDHTLDVINRVASSILIGFGALILARLVLFWFGLA